MKFFQAKKAKHYAKTNEAAKVETKKKKSIIKRVALVTALCILAAGLYFGGRILYFGVINPRAAFDTSLHTKSAVSIAPSPVISEDIEDPEETPSPSPAAIASAVAPEETAPPPEEAQEPGLSKADLEFIRDKVNILLIGVDENPQREETRVSFRSDVLLLLCLDFNEKSVHMLSVPRDTYTSIYNTKGKWKVNAAFAYGGGIKGDGFEYAMMTVSNLFGGIPINYYAGVQMEGLKKLVDALGGVNYNVDIPVKMNGRVLKKGMQHLTGQQVLDYCRIRKGIGTDVNRVDRQQKLLLALFKQLQKENKLDLVPKAFEALKDEIYTNMSLEQIVALGVFANNMDASGIKRHTLKGEYVFAYGSKYYFLDQDAKADVIYDIFKIKIKTNLKNGAAYVKAYSEATNAISKANKLLTTYKKTLTDAEKTSIQTLIQNVTDKRKQLPASEAELAALVKESNSACYQTEQAIKARAVQASAAASAAPAVKQ